MFHYTYGCIREHYKVEVFVLLNVMPIELTLLLIFEVKELIFVKYELSLLELV